jgi:hypothetical protein
MTAATNILALPLASMQIETGTDEDWVDSIVWLVNSTDPINGQQLDLRGLTFSMQVRRAPPEHEVLINASTEYGGLLFGAPPDYGYLVIMIPRPVMQEVPAGAYVGDIVAQGDGYTRVCVQFSLDLVLGITRGNIPAQAWEGSTP